MTSYFSAETLGQEHDRPVVAQVGALPRGERTDVARSVVDHAEPRQVRGIDVRRDEERAVVGERDVALVEQVVGGRGQHQAALPVQPLRVGLARPPGPDVARAEEALVGDAGQATPGLDGEYHGSEPPLSASRGDHRLALGGGKAGILLHRRLEGLVDAVQCPLVAAGLSGGLSERADVEAESWQEHVGKVLGDGRHVDVLVAVARRRPDGRELLRKMRTQVVQQGLRPDRRRRVRPVHRDHPAIPRPVRAGVPEVVRLPRRHRGVRRHPHVGDPLRHICGCLNKLISSFLNPHERPMARPI